MIRFKMESFMFSDFDHKKVFFFSLVLVFKKLKFLTCAYDLLSVSEDVQEVYRGPGWILV